MPNAYSQGMSKALAWLGLADPPEESHLGRNIAMGAAGVAPFLGLIGQQRSRHNPLTDPSINRVSLEELARQARPGDMIASGKSGSPFTILTGSELWHAEPVLGRRGNKGISLSGGELTPSSFRQAGRIHPEQAAHYEEIAKAVEQDPARIERHLETLDKRLKAMGQDRLVLLRPKKELSAAEIEELRRVGYSKAVEPYKARRVLSAQLRDWFIPKIPGLERLQKKRCTGNICATPGAQAFESVHGHSVVPSKPTSATLGTDFTRSTHYNPVVAHVSETAAKSSPRLRQLGHLGLRAGLGLGLAGSIYGVTEDPATVAAPIGALAAPAAARRLFGHTAVRPLQQILKMDAKQGLRLRNISTRTLPLMLAGGLGAYLAARQGVKALTD